MPARIKAQKGKQHEPITYKNTSVSLPEDLWGEINERVRISDGRYSSVSHFIRVVVQNHCRKEPMEPPAE